MQQEHPFLKIIHLTKNSPSRVAMSSSHREKPFIPVTLKIFLEFFSDEVVEGKKWFSGKSPYIHRKAFACELSFDPKRIN